VLQPTAPGVVRAGKKSILRRPARWLSLVVRRFLASPVNEALPKQIPLRPIPVGAKVRLGIAYGLPWFFISTPTWDNLYSLRPYHEGIPFRAALIFIILPFVVGWYLLLSLASSIVF
jgi:hypothetical protein